MTDIAELFRRDPLSLSNQDLDEIIAAYRKARASFNMVGKKPRAAKPKAKPDPKAVATLARLGIIQPKS